ncbi:hypothetical protein FISHEDRAFT_69282 [Fistulina hepatica ATCC 64428]|uniref:Uncharacterized protein n=1 Tax=Fistulina hepatica ATCC 64428 TaxID=1128425 RepID=A0A0D7ANI4_9AGAR|nr:hypothetical protein FISHEDRAFT_69282 [Fistulina hepatica ATCC 64428]
MSIDPAHTFSTRKSPSTSRRSSGQFLSGMSVPGSPSSAHSASSAIFERDIESILSPSSPHHINPHLIPRAKATEQLEQSVPSVLDSAAAVLAEVHVSAISPSVLSPAFAVEPHGDDITVEIASPVAPGSMSPVSAAGSLQAQTSPIVASPMVLSRSPSPPGTATSLTVNPPQSAMAMSVVDPQSPVSAYFSPAGSSYGDDEYVREIEESVMEPRSCGVSVRSSAASVRSHPPTSPRGRQRELSPRPPSNFPRSISNSRNQGDARSSSPPPAEASEAVSSRSITISPPVTSPAASVASAGPVIGKASSTVSKRLSFLSYTDLLASTPSTTLPLSTFVGPSTVQTPQDPPHITALSLALSSSSVPSSRAASIFRGREGTREVNDIPSGNGAPSNRNSMLLPAEWEREGLGKGLEERLLGVASV